MHKQIFLLPLLTVALIIPLKKQIDSTYLNPEFIIKNKTNLNSNAYVLYWDRDKFLNWYDQNGGATKIIFQFQFDNQGKITLDGWAATDDEYSDDYASIDDIIIDEANTNDVINLDSKLPINFSNLKLRKNTVKKIYDRLTTNASLKYILFKPKISDDNEIYYQIYLSDDLGNKLLDKNAKVGKADPSPPATFK